MVMFRADVVVIGGGPAGLIAAADASQRGLSVTLIEEDVIFGRPERCAGLYSIRGLEKIGVPLHKSYIQNFIWGGVIHSPGGEVFELSSATPVAVVAAREALDRYLAERAIGSGVDVLLGSRAVSCSVEAGGGGYKVVLNDGGEASAQALVIAEGASATLARRLFSSYSASYWIPISQLIVKNHGLDRRQAHVWFKNYLKDFFGYLVPINEEIGKLGVAARHDPLAKAHRLLREEIPGSKVIGYSSHSIYRGPPLEVGLDGNILLVGDVAGQVKATTGGGVVVGGLCARAAASHVYSLLKDRRGGVYRRSVSNIYRELKATYLVAKTIYSMSDKAIDALVRAASESGLSKTLALRGDMDFQITGLARSLASYSGLRFLAGLLRSLF
ncbi:MAG: NAD(P)/FAD-dependent oxidoreductase [Nitrososphaerota archaeon]